MIDREVLQDQPWFYAGYYGAETLLSRNPKLDALYFQDDGMAIGGMTSIVTRELSVPGHIGIAGWGGMEAASIQPRCLTTMVFPTTRLGKADAEILVGRLRGDLVPHATVIPTHLVHGETV